MEALAYIQGRSGIRGTVRFSQRSDGTLVTARIMGLPREGFFAFHIHRGSDCANTGGHFDPTGLPHPSHAGDLPPLLSCHGKAFLSLLTDRFSTAEVIGRTVVIHSGPDDFTSQPSGNPGEQIACGLIAPCPTCGR